MYASPRKHRHWLALYLSAVGLVAGMANAEELVFLTWADYIDPGVVADFERRFDVKVKYMYFASDDDRDELMSQSAGAGYDVILADGLSTIGYANLGWLAPLPLNAIPNRVHIESKWQDAFPGTRGFGVPYTWGVIGIAYRRDLVSKAPTRWMDLFRPPPEWRGKIVMNKHGRGVMGMALKALGYSQNSTDREALDQAQQLLIEQKPFVKAYSYVALGAESGLVTGEVWAAMVFNGDSITLQSLHREIAYVVPVEGSNIGVDFLTIGAASHNRTLAAAFINFVNEPVNAARIARYIHFATPNHAAAAHLPREFFENKVIYPDAATMEHSEFLSDLPAHELKVRNEILQRIYQ